MHMRASMARGTMVIADLDMQVMGFIESPLINPDTGHIAGFFVDTGGMLGPDMLFLSSADIVSWGTRVHILSADHLSPPDELIRLQTLLSDPRPFIGQRIIAKKSRQYFGVCADVQFDTRHLNLQWIFPRKFFFIAGEPIAASDIVEVTQEAIIINDPIITVRLPAKNDMIERLPVLAEILPPTA